MDDIESGVGDGGLEELLLSIDRPGDYCVGGRLYAAMPKLTVEGVGDLSFPVPASQLRALIAASQLAPYGKGTKTLVDTSVRDCRQIDVERIRLAGRGWRDSFDEIMDRIARGLGLSRDLLGAELYKLLVYEPGGFFSSHRDTEKSDGMVATLSVTLPTPCVGGELVVRHGDRETVFDMNAEEPSEVVFAAFYADCPHAVRPVVEGYRVSLVFNLCLRSPGETPPGAPDYAAIADRAAESLSVWRKKGATDKLVWVLDHQYSEEGLSFDALKGIDAARARVLSSAADRAGCELHAAVLHIEEYGLPLLEVYDGGWGSSWDTGYSDSQFEEVIDAWRWLDGWTGRDAGRPPFGRVPLNDHELLPAGALDDAEPDERRLKESTGNEGAKLELTYRLAAFVVWPRSKTVDIVASGRIDGAGRAEMLRFLSAAADGDDLVRFVRRVTIPKYDGSENEALADVMGILGPTTAAEALSALVREHLARRPKAISSLLIRIGEAATGASAAGASAAAWREVAREGAKAALLAVPAALAPAAGARRQPDLGERPDEPFDHDALRDLLVLAGRFRLMDEAETAARAIADHPERVTPERVLPAALADAREHEGVAGADIYACLWRVSADALLARSSLPPEAPRDWAVAADLPCDCEHCASIRAFCEDPVARSARFPLRKDLRRHLHREIDRYRVDLTHVTERRGSPYTLICTKTRASHNRRLAEYAEDVACMRSLLRSAPPGERDDAPSSRVAQLAAAVAAAPDKAR
ncbi:2OG-Fe(II) oxygenase [Candidatus Palauibacter sp.]|uniref:2OG-Fe(II) oxygenase n=1 Tax=Candidatus Palauibacter sp. TaxID=3101350 RepID=UPI003C6EC961